MAKEGLKMPNGDFEITHAMCALLAEGVKKVDPEKFEGATKRAIMQLETGKTLDEYFDYKMPDELLAQFPRAAIVHYSFFSRDALDIRSFLTTWSRWVEYGDSTLLTAEAIYNQWTTIKNFFASARALRDILIEKGNVSKKDATELMNKQLEEIKKRAAELISAKPKLEAALTSLREEMEKKKATTAEQLSV